MLIKQAALKAVEAGKVTLAFRRWRRPTVRAGGTLNTAIGVLAIDSVEPVTLPEITEEEARSAGHPNLVSLHKELAKRSEGELVRIRFHYAGPDPRIALRGRAPESEAEWDEIRMRLDRWDRASPTGPWTAVVMTAIAARPATRAAELAVSLSMDTKRFKTNVRKLKGLGLTESLRIGYRLSPRGEAVRRDTAGRARGQG